jgi:hypothetical protein
MLGVGVGVLAADSQSTSAVLGIGPPFGTVDQIFTFLFLLCLTITFFFFRRLLLCRENGSVDYSAITH